MKAAAIVAACVGMAIVYGIVLDQFTARICPEYFTVGHPPIFATESPTLLALGWGILASWWVGLILGIALAVAARAGRSPRRGSRSLLRPIAALLGLMAGSAPVAGLVGYAAARSGLVYLVEPLATRIAEGRHARFLADLWAHTASYLVGLVGGSTVIVRVWRSRGRTAPPLGVRSTPYSRRTGVRLINYRSAVVAWCRSS